MERNPVTPEGFEQLQADLKHAKSVLRPSIVRAIEEARAHGDLSENAEYSSAKEAQSLNEARIARLETLVASAEVIDVTKLPPSKRVVFGTWVDLENLDTGQERTWRIVGESESDIENQKISFKAPLARALIGRSEGDEVTVPTPSGPQSLVIVEVRYA